MKHWFFFQRPGAAHALVKAILFSLMLAGASHWATLPLHAAIRNWTGAASGNWSNPNNWNPVGVPQDGEILRFEADSNLSMINDMVGLSAGSLGFVDHNYVLSGNLLRVGSLGVDVRSGSQSVNINCPLVLANASTRIECGEGSYCGYSTALHLNADINLDGHTLILDCRNPGCGGNAKIEVSGSISGDGDVNVETIGGLDGRVDFIGTAGNTFSGTLRVKPLVVGNTDPGVYFNKPVGVVVTNRLEVLRGTAVNLQRPDQIGDNATVVISAGSKLLLNGHDDTIRNLILTNSPADTLPSLVDPGGATLTLLGGITSWADNGSVSPMVIGRLSLPPGNHIFDIGGPNYSGLDMQAQIGGGGGFSKFGNSALLLQSSNSFTGNVSVNAGIVDARNNKALGSTASGTTLSGNGSLILRGVLIAGETLFVRGTQPVTVNTAGSFLSGIGLAGWVGRIELDTNLVVNSTDLCFLGGPIVGVGGLEFLGVRHQILNASIGPNPYTFTGTTRVLCELLAVSADNPFHGPVIVGGGFGSLCEMRWENSVNNGLPLITLHPNALVNLNGRTDTFSQIVFSGGRIITGAGRLYTGSVTANATNVTASIEGNLSPAGSTLTLNVADGPATPDLLISAAISDLANTSELRKQGLGEVLLSAANAYDGATTIEAGVLYIQNASSLGTIGQGTTVLDGGTLQIEFIDLAEPLNLRGAGRGGTNGALYLMAATSVSANIVLSAATIVRNDVSFAILSGVISGTGPFTKIGAGTLQFGGSSGGNNTFTGDTLVNAGTLVLFKAPGAQVVPGNLIIGTRTVFNESGTAATVTHFRSDAIAGTHVTVNGGSLYNLNGLNESLVGVVLNAGGSIQTGNGTLSLIGGADPRVLVNPGEDSASIISGRLFLDAGGTFTVGNRFGIFFNPAPELDVTAAVSGGGDIFAVSLVKDGSGQMRLSASNTFASRLDVNEGALIAANANALGSTAKATVVNNGSKLVLDGGGLFINNETLVLNSSNAFALDCRSGSNTWTGAITLGQTTGINVSPANGYLQALNTVSGAGGLIKMGPGTLQFWGSPSNSYGGLTVVNSGVLEGGRISVVSIPGDAVIGDDSTTNVTATLRSLRDQQLKRGANVTLHRSGVLDLFHVNNIPTPFERLRTLTGSGLVRVGLAARLIISNDVPFEFFGPMTGTGSFTKNGPGTMTMWGDWSLLAFGSLDVFGGDLLVHGTIDSVTNSVRSGARLRGDGRLTGPVGVAPGGALAVDSKFPDHQGGDLEMDSLTLLSGPGITLAFDIYGPSATGGNDKLVVDGAVRLNSATVAANFHYPPREGDVITLLNKTTAGAIVGSFGGNYAAGLHKIGDHSVLVSYTGGDGNDFTLTVTNLSLSYTGYALAEGNGTQTIEPNECNLLYVTLLNRRTTNLFITNAVLRATTSNAVVTIPTAKFPTMLAGLTTANITPFQFRTDTNLPCGSSVSFELVLGVLNEGEFAVTFTPIGGLDCANQTGPCESCTVVSGQFTTNTPVTSEPLYFVGAPSVCYPPKACPGVDPATNLPPMRYLTHSFTNSTTNEVCITAQLRFDCPLAPTNALGASAYLGSFFPNQPCANYLGDIGLGGPLYPSFSFRVPAGSNFVLVVTARATNLVCDNYALELFGLPCAPPTLAIAKDAAPGKVRLSWSTAYPEWQLQSTNSLGSLAPYPFANVIGTAAVVNGRYTVTNDSAGPANFFRLKY